MNFSDLFWNEGFLSGCRLAGFLAESSILRVSLFSGHFISIVQHG